MTAPITEKQYFDQGVEAILASSKLQATMMELMSSLEMIAGAMTADSKIRRDEIAARTEEAEKKLRTTHLMLEAAMAMDEVPRQTLYLARTTAVAEAMNGTAISPAELLRGIVNAVERSGIDLTQCPSREDAEDTLLNYLGAGASVLDDAH